MSRTGPKAKIAKGIGLGQYFFSQLTSRRASLSQDELPPNQFQNRRVRDSIAEFYHENTKLRRYQANVLAASSQIFLSPERLASMAFAGNRKMGKSFPLPMQNMTITACVGDVLKSRRSVRRFGKSRVPLDKLSKLLFYTSGITGVLPVTVPWEGNQITLPLPLRACPSAGGLYPIDTYVAVLNIDGLPQGLYFYDVARANLVFLNQRQRELIASFVPLPPGSSLIDDAGFLVLLTASFLRNRVKYGERGYRYVLQEAGHLAQNIYIVSESLGLGAVAVGGFYDDEVNDILSLDGVEEAVVYAVVVGSSDDCEPK